MYSRPKLPRRTREGGIALFSVLWLLLLLSTLAAAASFVARNNAILVHQSWEVAETEQALDGAIVAAIRDLSDKTRSRRPPIDGTATMWHDGKLEGEITVQREAGRIDLNYADSTLIGVFLQSQGMDGDDAARMASSLRSYVGGESVRNRGVPIAPGGNPLARPLISVEELKRVPGWTENQVNCWAESFTVYTGLSGVSPGDVGLAVENALRWGADHHVEGYAEIKKQAESALFNLESLAGTVFRIVAKSSGNGHPARVWVGRITGEPARPMLTYRWDWDNGLNARCHQLDLGT